MFTFFSGTFFGICLVAIAVQFLPNPKHNTKLAIESCEASLPRDQHCVVIAIPVSKD
jgi:hypothetical protein